MCREIQYHNARSARCDDDFSHSMVMIIVPDNIMAIVFQNIGRLICRLLCWLNHVQGHGGSDLVHKHRHLKRGVWTAVPVWVCVCVYARARACVRVCVKDGEE